MIPTLAGLLAIVVALMVAYALRHLMFTLNRLFGRQRHPYLDIDVADWPMVTVLVPAHNEEAVIGGCLEALAAVDYPPHRLKIVPIDDRSTDNTAEIIRQCQARHPARIHPFFRTEGAGGKSAALKDALAHAEGEIILLFDADYVPSRALIKRLAAPFFDPEVGAVMGRVVPSNTGCNALTRLLDIERSAGYQVDQQARMNMRLVPQFGGTVGGVRRIAVDAVGGWDDAMLTEDTDITIRLVMHGWKVAYTNRSECHEEVPQEWAVRVQQVRRWSRGHNQVMLRHGLRYLTSRRITTRERVDGIMLLGVFAMPVVLLAGWLLVAALYFMNASQLLLLFIPLLILMSYGTLGNFAAFFEMAVAVLLDGNRKRIRLLPLNLLGFIVSLFAIVQGFLGAVADRITGRVQVWDKTRRYRLAEAAR